MAPIIVGEANRLKTPFIFHWRKENWRPWSWRIHRIENDLRSRGEEQDRKARELEAARQSQPEELHKERQALDAKREDLRRRIEEFETLKHEELARTA